MPVDVEALVERLLHNLQLSRAADRAALRTRLNQCVPEELHALRNVGADGRLDMRDVLQAAAAAEIVADHASAFSLFPGLRDMPAFAQAGDFNAFDWTFEEDPARFDVLGWAPSLKGRVRWVLTNTALQGPVGLGRAARKLWRSHTEADAFVYAIPDATPERSVKVAIFGDGGMPRAESASVARQMAAWEPDVAVHLGDIYASGTKSEIQENYARPLEALLRVAELWSIPGDHERFTQAGRPWRDFIDDMRGREIGDTGRTHRQRSSYFCLQNKTVKLIAVDGNSVMWNRFPPDEENGKLDPIRQRTWLRARLTPTTTNILLSQSPPHHPRKERPTRFGADAAEALDEKMALIHAWIWGDTHHAAVYAPSAERDYVSVACGHAAFPEHVLPPPEVGAFAEAPRFWEDSPRYGQLVADPSILQTDRERTSLEILGRRCRNGWCKMELLGDEGNEGHVLLELVDWMGISRYKMHLAPGDGGGTILAQEYPPDLTAP